MMSWHGRYVRYVNVLVFIKIKNIHEKNSLTCHSSIRFLTVYVCDYYLHSQHTYQSRRSSYYHRHIFRHHQQWLIYEPYIYGQRKLYF